MVLTPSPQLQLETLFSLDARGRIVATREPQPQPGPAFILIRGSAACAWALRSEIDNNLANALELLAKQEPPSMAWDQPPLHARRYQELLAGEITWGPAFAFPERLPSSSGKAISIIDDEAELDLHFSGWVPGEIAAGRSPVVAVREAGHAVSVCFCARRSSIAAEAGVETAAAFRDRGYATRVTAAWAAQLREIGLTPLYSTQWSNRQSLAVARKLELIPYAMNWSIG